MPSLPEILASEHSSGSLLAQQLLLDICGVDAPVLRMLFGVICVGDAGIAQHALEELSGHYERVSLQEETVPPGLLCALSIPVIHCHSLVLCTE